ncbi:MFS transporter [Sporolactobacillus putidus]|uniref:MFS transporter n=1 Tax=Sporolactobacillus putidus TaxID=492735 RepID=A0A917S5C3_9BACL|nr:MFS transporter [Sporolactobacillus putidus]GGL59252.1 MFS transporter [Sporolactobacillus putidus]
MAVINNQPTVADRMNRLPASHVFLKMISCIAAGGLFEFYELFLAGAIGVTLVKQGLISTTGLAYFIGSGFFGMFFGTTIFGRASDKIGRKNGYVYSLLIYSLFTVLLAFAPNQLWIDLLRFGAGLGVGAQLVIIDTYISELTPSKHRGFYVAFAHFITFLAVPIVTLLSYFLVPTHFLIDGWRWVVMIGGLGSVFIWWIRLGLPESPRWLEKRGRTEEADKEITKIEQLIFKEKGSLPPVTIDKVQETEKGAFSEIFKPPYRSRTIMLIIFNIFQTVGFYGFASWVPTLLVSEGVTLVHSLLYTFIIALANPFGPLLGMATSDRFERKWLIVLLSLGIAVSGTIFSLMRIPFWIIVIGLIITLFNNWFSAIYHSYQAELFPTRLRATGVGFSYSWGRLSSAFSGIIIAQLLVHFGVIGVFAFISVSMLIVAFVIGVFGPRTSKQDLEVISPVQ